MANTHGMNHQSDSVLLNAEAAAALLLVRPGTLRNWRGAKYGPRFVRVGRRACYRPSDIVAWLETHVVESAAAKPPSGRRSAVPGNELIGTAA